MKLTRIKKYTLITLASILIVLAVLILFLSPISKYLIEKYDEKYLGRQVHIDWVFVNPASGYVYMKNMRISEVESDTLFFKAKSVHARLSLYKLLRGVYEVNELEIEQPEATIIQFDSTFNFTDLIVRFASKDSVLNPDRKKIHFNINKISIFKGVFHYRDEVIPVFYTIKDVDLVSTGFQWNSDTVYTNYSFVSGNGKGIAKGNVSINTKSLNYRMYASIEKYDLKFLEQYILDVAKYGNFEGNLNANVHAKGNFLDAQILDARGFMELKDFKFGKNSDEDFASFDRFILDVKHLNPAEHIYDLDSAILIHPYIRYERYDEMDNYSRMFEIIGGDSGINVNPSRFNLIFEVAEYVTELSHNFFRSDYKVNKLAVLNANFTYNDYALNEKFTTELSPLNLRADSINKSSRRVELQLRSGIEPEGDFKVDLSINPKDSSDFDMVYKFEKVPVTLFNPYLLTYTSMPMDRGSVRIDGEWHVRNGEIKSTNHIVVVDPRLGKRVKQKDVRRLPLPLILYFVLERGNVIDYEIPVNGNLNNPRFHLKDVLLDFFSNIFAKPPTTPYRIKVKHMENEIERSIAFKWEFRQSHLFRDQENFMEKIADFLQDNPKAVIHIEPAIYEIKEKEHILFYEAKKTYYKHRKKLKESEFSEQDSIKLGKMSIRDSGFIDYLNTRTKHKKLLYTIQGKCMEIVGGEKVNSEYRKLIRSREKEFMNYFATKGVGKQIVFRKSSITVPFNGYSIFKMQYSGTLPEDLLEAYDHMYDMNNSSPRKRFKKERLKK